MDPLFTVHMLNETGKTKATKIAYVFTNCLHELETLCNTKSREFSLVRTKLEEASFFAKKSMASCSENQVVETAKS